MTVTARPMSADRVLAWRIGQSAAYVASRMRSGESAETAKARAQESAETNFPGGRPLAIHHLLEILDDGEPVGELWVGPSKEGSLEWWIFEIMIDEAHRRKGLGRAAMQIAEEIARQGGARQLGLNVFGFNSGARALYESIGYETASVQMRKTL